MENRWWNYKLAGDLPPDVVERMWRALDAIARRADVPHPGHVDFITKQQIAEIAYAALPSNADCPRHVADA